MLIVEIALGVVVGLWCWSALVRWANMPDRPTRAEVEAARQYLAEMAGQEEDADDRAARYVKSPSTSELLGITNFEGWSPTRCREYAERCRAEAARLRSSKRPHVQFTVKRRMSESTTSRHRREIAVHVDAKAAITCASVTRRC